jgi:uncharacterized DUF497 family protein
VIVEWDDQKAAANARKHGVTFQEAATVLEHALSITFRDPYGGSHRSRGSRSADLGQASHAK